MTISAGSVLVNTPTDAPPTTWSSGSFSYVANRIYVAFVTQYRTDSTDPPTPTATFAGNAMTEQLDDLWDSTTSSRRRSTAFTYVPSNSGTTTVAATAGSAPAFGSVTVVELTTDGEPTGTLVPQTASGDVSGPADSLQEIAAMSALASSGNALVACVAANVDISATARLEQSGDTGGDDTWTTGTIATNTSPSASIIPGFLIGGTDLTPGYYQNTGTPSAHLLVLEISETTTPVSSSPIGDAYIGVFAGSAPSIVQPSGMFIGATVDPEWPETGVEAIANLESELGVPKLDIIRTFQGGAMPTTYAGGGNHNDWDSHIGVRHRVISVKGEPTQAQLETFIQTIPTDQYLTWLIVHHEPENDGGNHTPAWFQTMLNNLHAAWQSVDGGNSRADVIPSLCLMTWLERDSNANTTSADWFPSSGIIGDFTLWLDPYDPQSRRTLQQQTEATVDLWEAAGGGPWGIAETGTKRTGAEGATWITQGCAWARSRGAVGWCWFHSAVGNDGPWWLTDPDMLEAMGAEVVGV